MLVVDVVCHKPCQGCKEIRSPAVLPNCAKSFVTREGVKAEEMIRCARSDCYRGGNGQDHESDDTERGIGAVAAKLPRATSHWLAWRALGFRVRGMRFATALPGLPGGPGFPFVSGVSSRLEWGTTRAPAWATGALAGRIAARDGYRAGEWLGRPVWSARAPTTAREARALPIPFQDSG